MSKAKTHVGNPLGDLQAERDHKMLDVAFYPTPDYRSLVESGDKTVVVGRRGTGKSALAYHLGKHWRGVPKTRVVQLSLEEDQVIGLKPWIQRLGNSYRLLSASFKLIWRYCLIMEIILELAPHFKFGKADANGVLANHLQRWRDFGNSASSRMRRLLNSIGETSQQPEQLIADLADKLGLRSVEDCLDSCLETLAFNVVVLIDRLDEGYEPTEGNVGMVDGIVDATVSVNLKHQRRIRSVLFLRDNVFRAIAKRNPDFTRSIEGQALRLHWSEYDLMQTVCKRLRVTFKLADEQTVKIWNSCVANELKGREGFRECLRLTLYRPRDILVLLNEAFYCALKADREQIVIDDVRAAGKTISVHRLEDLVKEYSAIIPGLEYLTKAFANRKPEFIVQEMNDCILDLITSSNLTATVLQEFAILSEPLLALRELYGIGFVGIRDSQLGSYVFCHDGNSPDREIGESDTLLVHPCYWMALNLSRDALAPSIAEEINDEYDITITESTPLQRVKKLNEAISRLGMIPIGDKGQSLFENWCQTAVATVFATSLHNVTLTNSVGTSGPRELLGLNLPRAEPWTRLAESYDMQRALFVLYNRQKLDRADYEEAAHRCLKRKEQVAFLITRDESVEMSKEDELSWVREICESNRIIIVRLTAKLLLSLLGKLRNPKKKDAIEKSFGGYITLYLDSYLKGLSDKIAIAATEARAVATISIDAPVSQCYGELDVGDESVLLRVFYKKQGPGKRSEVCDPIVLKNQAYAILLAGIETARRNYIEAKVDQVRSDGTAMTRPECEPTPEMSFEVEWTRDQLATILHDREKYAGLTDKQRDSIKTAMHRVRSLVKFTNDQCGLVSEPVSDGARRSLIPLRLRK